MSTRNQLQFFDYEYSLRNDRKWRHELEKKARSIDALSEEAKRKPAARRRQRDEILGLLRHTNYNLSPLLGYYFPKYPKNKPFSLRNFPYAHAMFNITLGRDAVMCIKGSRQIIKSTCLAIRDILALRLFFGLHVMLVVPRVEQLKTVSDKYNEVNQAFRFGVNSRKHRDNLTFKEYPNGSVLKMVYILSNADKARGNSMDWLNFDEYQDFDNNLELEIAEVLTQSDIPMITKTGTSKTVDTALEATYGTTTRSVWAMVCDACRHENTPTLENNVMDMILPRGLCCSKCGTPLNVRNGFWIHRNPKMLKSQRIGLHVPKVIVPENTERPDKWYPIYKQALSKDRKNFLEEVLGIATQEGAREITQRELENICNLGPQAGVLKKARNRKYKYIVSGCDWGGSDWVPEHNLKESYTVHVMIGVTPDWNFEIIDFQQYSGMQYDEISGSICARHKEFKAHSMASDFGVGMLYNMEMRKRIDPHKHVIFDYTGPKTPFINRPKNVHLYNQMSLNKTDSITSLFNDLKSGRIFCYNWEESSDYLLQFLNLIRSPNKETRQITFRRHGARPDDALHALNFAVQLAKIVIGEMPFEDEAIKIELQARLKAPFGSTEIHLPGSNPGVVIG